LDIIWDLACLREAASAKAGAWGLVLMKHSQYFVAILRTISFIKDPKTKSKGPKPSQKIQLTF
jgi:hypothetical protein